uniref:COG2308 Uncharacterized conserved protein n=1 Tax=uncultured bacterium B3TF_MPn1 TaxID=1439866 RepID=W0NQF9_9BACT|nr:COG2308 Uncharacterized conserved protein [uncultured bacterium B3TF_MPn1]
MNHSSNYKRNQTQAENEKLEQLVMQYGKACHVAFDEMLSNGDTALIKDHWIPLMKSLGRSDTNELENKHHEARRVMRESGVTYNVYNDPQGRNRALQLDPVPMLMTQNDWSDIEAGLVQRAELLNLIFKDIYAEQTILKEGLLPPEIIFAHQGYHRNCVGLYANQRHPIVNYTADMARGPDGKMWVFSDRVQAPSGAGYALETRIAMSRIMTQEFKENQVRRLSHYFRLMRSALTNLGMHNQKDPHIVLLTPGPLNETYFEHAYLSSYLGYTLVQGADLTVRDGKVWMKSLGGLQQVDVILRRVDDSFCDPLELMEDSQLGVPGLLQAVRERNVIVVNPLGSGIVESPGMYPFLNNIAKARLGEELKLASAASWWCGHKKEREYVLENLDKLVIKAIDRRFTTIFGGSLSSTEIQDLRDKINAQPYLYIGQERLICSSAPSLVGSEILPRRILFRSFLVAAEGSYQAMPGGLTRISPDNDSFLITNQTGGVSKDTWIISEHPEHQRSLLPDVNMVVRSLHGENLLPSRSAENLFWVGRYAERVEDVVRLLRTALRKISDFTDYGDDVDQKCLVKILKAVTALTGTFPGFMTEEETTLFERPEKELLDVAFDVDRTGSLINTLKSLYYGAFNLRDLWSSDTWRIIDDIGELISSIENRRPTLISLHNDIDKIIDAFMAFAGVTQESMSHESGRFMFDLGKRLERGLQLVKLLRSLLTEYDSEHEELLNIEALMASQESLITYRRQFRLTGSAVAAINLLVLDQNHPRSVAYQLLKLQNHFDHFPQPTTQWFSNKLTDEQKKLLELCTFIQMSEPDKLAMVDEHSGQRIGLIELLNKVEKGLFQVSDDITHRYFSHTDYGRQLAPQRYIDSVKVAEK